MRSNLQTPRNGPAFILFPQFPQVWKPQEPQVLSPGRGTSVVTVYRLRFGDATLYRLSKFSADTTISSTTSNAEVLRFCSVIINTCTEPMLLPRLPVRYEPQVV